MLYGSNFSQNCKFLENYGLNSGTLKGMRVRRRDMTSNSRSQKNMHLLCLELVSSQSYRFSNVHIADTLFPLIAVLFKTLLVARDRILSQVFLDKRISTTENCGCFRFMD